ncbi:hypothetical protein HY857_01865 [Candidatus Saccharibacteria bacterium]|nr:hypothetical protein [Candidatus Saccharibacteria bacterium]
MSRNFNELPTNSNRRQWVASKLSDIALLERGEASAIVMYGIASDDGKKGRLVTREEAPEVDMRLRERLSGEFPELSLIGHNID